MGHFLLSKAIMSWYTKLRPSTITIPCIIIFSIVVNCHQTSVFVSLNHFPTISVTLLVTGSTKIDSRLNLWQNISSVSVSMAEMTRPGSVTIRSAHCHGSFIYIHAYGLSIKIRWLQTYGYIRSGHSCH